MEDDRELRRISAAQMHFSAYLEWVNLSCSTIANSKVPAKELLCRSTGAVKSGEFLAVMGPSGAGKTTLLNFISGKNQPLLVRTSGEILLNKIPIEDLFYKAMIGFVPQQDIILECLTPREALRFAAIFTVNKSPDIIEQLVDQALDELKLVGCADRVIGGGATKSISGSERKRVSIGTELIFNPSVLFLDEPTTGLDSYTALKLVELLNYLAKKKARCIIATIHQPSSQIFCNFDKLLLLNHGKTVYMGEAKGAVDYFGEIGHPLPLNYNPADHFLKVLSTHEINPRSSFSPVKMGATKQSFHTEIDGDRVEVDFDEPKPHFIAGSWFAFFKLCYRAHLNNKRNPMILKVKLLKLLISSSMCCTLFWSLPDIHSITDSDSVKNFRMRCAAVFIISATFLAEALLSTIATFQEQKYVFFREYGEARYGILPYYLSYSIMIFPIEFLWNLLLTVIVYWAVGLNNHAANFFRMVLLGVLMAMNGTGFGLFCSIVAPNLELASVIAPVFFIMFNLTSGFLVTNNKIPDWFFIKYISTLRYGFEAAVHNEFDNTDSNKFTTDYLIDELHLPDSMTDAFIYIGILFIAVRVLCYFVLWFKVRKL
ncbi:hypothetical protein SteCoe_27150 [Stentor coeruleus]|uniref:ABC transporter domain-containing protein n=1 Tax=Stentor coeruleus TaxID=5963 RepID=A0A1R2BB89_9CILI|nr:hypothetical protein SteCoe_27150 [Stentor coeruleus]